MSTRREFARKTIGALFGVSIIGECFSVPEFTPCLPKGVFIPPVSAGAGFVDYFYMGPATSRCCQPPDISIAQKLHIKDMLG